MTYDIYNRSLGTSIPEHVKNRIAALLNGDPVHVVGEVMNTDGARTGFIVAFSDRLVVRADLDGTRFPDPMDDWRPDSTVTARVWRRRDLVGIEIESARGNADDRWEEAAWPAGSSARLHFRDGSTVEIKVRGERRDSIEATTQFMSGLHDDLAASEP